MMNQSESMAEKLARVQQDVQFHKKTDDKGEKLWNEYGKNIDVLSQLLPAPPLPILEQQMFPFLLEYQDKLYLRNGDKEQPHRFNNYRELLCFLGIPHSDGKQFSNVYQNLYKNLVQLAKHSYNYDLSEAKADLICDPGTEVWKRANHFMYLHAMRSLYFAYGIPDFLMDYNKFICINSFLFYRESASYVPLPPQVLQNLYRNTTLSMGTLSSIFKTIKCFCPKIADGIHKGIRYNYLNCHYSIIYKQQRLCVQRISYQVAHTVGYALDLSSETTLNTNKDRLEQPLSDLSNTTISGIHFWGKLIASAYSTQSSQNLYLVYYDDYKKTVFLFDYLEKLFKNICLINFQSNNPLEELISYQTSSNHLGVVFNPDGLQKNYNTIIKMAKGQPIPLFEEFPIPCLNYKNTMPLLVLFSETRELEKMKKLCEKNQITYQTLNLLKINDNCSLPTEKLTCLKWLFISSHYHAYAKRKPVLQTYDSLLLGFFKSFCTITGNKDDNYRSMEFYSTYILPYFQCNQMKELGYKRFNKWIKLTYECLITVAPIHKSKEDNVQHIIGLKFDDSKFQAYLENVDSLAAKELEAFHNYKEALYGHVEQDFKKISSAIFAYNTSMQSCNE